MEFESYFQCQYLEQRVTSANWKCYNIPWTSEDRDADRVLLHLLNDDEFYRGYAEATGAFDPFLEHPLNNLGILIWELFWSNYSDLRFVLNQIINSTFIDEFRTAAQKGRQEGTLTNEPWSLNNLSLFLSSLDLKGKELSTQSSVKILAERLSGWLESLQDTPFSRSRSTPLTTELYLYRQSRLFPFSAGLGDFVASRMDKLARETLKQAMSGNLVAPDFDRNPVDSELLKNITRDSESHAIHLLFSAAGTGKTRQIFDLLRQCWGFYFFAPNLDAEALREDSESTPLQHCLTFGSRDTHSLFQDYRKMEPGLRLNPAEALLTSRGVLLAVFLSAKPNATPAEWLRLQVSCTKHDPFDALYRLFRFTTANAATPWGTRLHEAMNFWISALANAVQLKKNRFPYKGHIYFCFDEAQEVLSDGSALDTMSAMIASVCFDADNMGIFSVPKADVFRPIVTLSGTSLHLTNMKAGIRQLREDWDLIRGRWQDIKVHEDFPYITTDKGFRDCYQQHYRDIVSEFVELMNRQDVETPTAANLFLLTTSGKPLGLDKDVGSHLFDVLFYNKMDNDPNYWPNMPEKLYRLGVGNLISILGGCVWWLSKPQAISSDKPPAFLDVLDLDPNSDHDFSTISSFLQAICHFVMGYTKSLDEVPSEFEDLFGILARYTGKPIFGDQSVLETIKTEAESLDYARLMSILEAANQVRLPDTIEDYGEWLRLDVPRYLVIEVHQWLKILFVTQMVADNSVRLRGRYRWSALYVESLIYSTLGTGSEFNLSRSLREVVVNASNKVAELAITALQKQIQRMKQDHNKRELVQGLYEAAYTAEVLSMPAIFLEETGPRLITEGYSLLKRWDPKSDKYNYYLEETLAIHAIMNHLRQNDPLVYEQQLLKTLKETYGDRNGAWLGKASEFFIAAVLDILLRQPPNGKPEPEDLKQRRKNLVFCLGQAKSSVNIETLFCSKFDLSNFTLPDPPACYTYRFNVSPQEWLNESPRSTFLFPDNNDGPDIIFTLQNVSPTGYPRELLCAVQSKTGKGDSPGEALDTINPQKWHRPRNRQRKNMPCLLVFLRTHVNTQEKKFREWHINFGRTNFPEEHWYCLMSEKFSRGIFGRDFYDLALAIKGKKQQR